MIVYYRNEIAELLSSTVKPLPGTYLENIYDSSFELPVMFDKKKVTITGNYEHPDAAAVDSLCLGYTNGISYKLKVYNGTKLEGSCSGIIKGRITIFNFDKPFFANKFKLTLEGLEDDDPLYLGYLFLGLKTVLPRFEVGPETGEKLFSQSSRSFGGQVFGIRRKTLRSFSANFPRITSEEREIFLDYIKSVLNIEPHIIDPYYKAHDKFLPMYAALNIDDNKMPKLNENGFYYSTSLEWQEAR